MLKPSILALIRQILTVAGTALVAKGYVQASDIEPLIGFRGMLGHGQLVGLVIVAIHVGDGELNFVNGGILRHDVSRIFKDWAA